MSAWGADAFEEVFHHDVDREVAREGERFNVPPGAGMFTEPWPLEGWPDVPTRVLVSRGDRLFPPAFQHRVPPDSLGLEIDLRSGGHLSPLPSPRERLLARQCP